MLSLGSGLAQSTPETIDRRLGGIATHNLASPPAQFA